ncbi:MAG: DUF484 family protein [Gammaproteobacteria bacterium]
MTTHNETNQALSQITAEDVADYLERHPEFFRDRPDLLGRLEVPHLRGGKTVSLVERQVGILREQNQKLRRQLHEMIEIARQNEELARRMHKLALTLMDAAEPADVFSTLYDNLKRNFHADQAVVRLFADPASADNHPGAEFAGHASAVRELFKTFLEKREPVCGRMKQQQQLFLFGAAGKEVASSVMVPLHGPDWYGILAIGSFNPERFQPGMGVELLANLGEVLSFILNPWVAGQTDSPE